MKFHGVFAVLVVGATSVATAQPKQQENSGRVSYSETEAASRDPKRDGEVVELATPTPANNGKEYIDVGEEAGRFSAVRLDAHDGRVIVRKIRIEYADGK